MKLENEDSNCFWSIYTLRYELIVVGCSSSPPKIECLHYNNVDELLVSCVYKLIVKNTTYS